MRPLIFLFFAISTCVLSKNNVKALTKSLGQEVIEIGPPVKELPPGLEEEPSAENEQDDKTTTTIQPATRRDSKKTTVTFTQKINVKSTAVTQDEDEAKIEKELAEMYKDSADYKSDSSEVTNDMNTLVPSSDDKPIGRQRTFKFQPDLNNRAEIERFRTSIDEISCDRKVTKKLSGQPVVINAASIMNISLYGILVWLTLFC